MKHIIVFALVSLLLVQVQLKHPLIGGCFSNSERIEHIKLICKFDVQTTECLQNFNETNVKFIKYECKEQLDVVTLHLSVLRMFRNLRIMDFSYLGIKVFSFDKITSISDNFMLNVKMLNASHNQLSNISNEIMNYMPNIVEIDFSYNEFISLDLNKFSAANLLIANFSHNQIENIVNRAISKLKRFQVLDLSYNNIKWIDDNDFINIPNIRALNLSGNPLEQLNCEIIFSKYNKKNHQLLSLEVLDLSNIHIQKINGDCFRTNPKMKELNLKGTQLKQFSFREFLSETSMLEVYLPSDSIEVLDISCAVDVKTIYTLYFSTSISCYFKNFEEDDFFKNIRFFNATGNRNKNIMDLLQKIGSNVTILDLSWNSIETLDINMLNRFTNLQHLNLSHSKLSTIEYDAFTNQTNLKSLDLSYNDLFDIDTVAFPFHWRLEHFNLDSNHLTSLKWVVPFILPRLKSLEILNNPFNPVYLKDFLDHWKYFNVTIAAIVIDVPWNERKGFVYGLLGLVFILICPVLCAMAFHFRREYLKRAELNNILNGDISGFNPEMSLDVQADLLPYVKKFEFPRNKIKLGKQLGAGAFGIVYEAMAEGILEHEKETKVAVKMLKNIASNEVSHFKCTTIFYIIFYRN